MPAGLSARGGKELSAHEVRDLLDRRLAREARGLTVSASVRLAGDRRDVELVDARSQADASGRAVLAGRLADENGHVGTFPCSQKIDDPFGVRLRGTDFGEVGAEQIGNDEAPPFEDLCPLQSARKQLELRELHRLVDTLEHAVDVRARLYQLGSQAQGLRRRV